jgi:glutamate--cysteine ligase
MRDGERLQDPDSVHGHIGRICFKTGPPTTVGAEVEWLLADPSDPTKPVPLDQLRTTLDKVGALPGGSKITYEPGGQLELSSRPANGLLECLSALQADVLTTTSTLGRLGLSTLPTAIDPYRKPLRQLKHPRYDAMEAFYDHRGVDGRVMMCSTAAIQVNLDAGTDPDDITRRWNLLNALGPVFVAAFANSPTHAGAPTGWKSGRQAVWQRIQPALGLEQFNDEYPAKRWTEYVLDAPVMLIRRDGDWLTDPGLTFREWLDGAMGERDGPTLDDLEYHLTTLFPPVRPRGFFEVRYVDMQAPDWWPVPVAVLTALTANARASELALAAAAPVAGEWLTATRCALADPALQQAAARCFDIALDVLPSLCQGPGGTELVDLVSAYYETYVRRGRCPADDVLEKQATMETPHESVAQPR